MTEAPPKRAVWDEARRADTAWSTALKAHRASPAGTPGIGDRIRATAAAARGLADVATKAAATGLAWAPFAPLPDGVDVLPGELAEEARWLSHPWVNVASAEHAAATAARGDSLEDLAAAMRLLADALQVLAGDADERLARSATQAPQKL